MSELLPYDLPAPAPDELIVQVGGSAEEPERVLHISRPVEGTVCVREWTSASWNTPPAERVVRADELLREFEQAAHQRRRISEELYRIRLWLIDGV